MTRRVLITGGAGFIGRHLTGLLRQRGWFVRWLDTADPQIHGQDAAHTIAAEGSCDQFLHGDVRDRNVVRESLQGIDTVVHLAAQTGTGQSMYQIDYYTSVNVGGTALLWDIIVSDCLPVKKVLVASSRSIYGEGGYLSNKLGYVVPEPRSREQMLSHQWEPCCVSDGSLLTAVKTPESSSPRPASLYACTKLAQEQMCLTMGGALGISTAALRFQNVYGPGQSLKNPYTGIISIFSNQLRQNLPLNIYEDGHETRDFVYVNDVVAACLLSLESTVPQLLLNVGSGIPTSVLVLAEALKRLWHSDSTVTVTGDFRMGDIRHNWADLRKIQAEFPTWKPTPLNDGLAAFVEWARSQPAYEDKTAQATQELKQRNL